LYEYETSYWWFRGLHSILLDALRGIGLDSNSRILDAGCGTGKNLLNISNEITNRAYGFDVAQEAAPFLAERGLDKVCLASINTIPFASNVFDAVVSVDVLECDAVNPVDAYAEMWRVVRPGGHIVVVVPAYDWLMTPEHHEAVHATRRFTKRRLKNILANRPVTILRLSHLFATLLPAVALYRLWLSRTPSGEDGTPVSELRPLHPVVNELLFRIVDLERRLLRIWNLPFGSSILAVVRKAN
jgi:SAM-dependent methyltransferase